MRLDTQTAEAEPEFSVLGQVFSSFIVVATPHELRLVDQHAAQERVLYEKFLGLLERGERPSQVVVPVEAPLSGRAYQFVQAQLHRLAELGFKLELTDTGMIIREVPILFKKVLSAEDIGEIIEYLQDSAAGEFDLTDYSQAALMLMACKGAIKANHRLSAARPASSSWNWSAVRTAGPVPTGVPFGCPLTGSIWKNCLPGDRYVGDYHCAQAQPGN